jgi:hypothetical protein
MHCAVVNGAMAAQFCIPRFLGWDEVLAEPDVVPAGQGASLG